MALPVGVTSKTLVFGRYTGVLGTNKGGTIKVGFDDAMLHVPTGEVVVAGMETVEVNPATGVAQLAVPVTITDQLIAKWRDSSAYYNQRLKITVEVSGYTPGTVYVEIPASGPDTIDFDQMSKYTTATGLEISQAAVLSVAGLTGHIAASTLAPALQPYIETGELTPAQLDEVSADVQADMEPPVSLVLLFENALV